MRKWAKSRGVFVKQKMNTIFLNCEVKKHEEIRVVGCRGTVCFINRKKQWVVSKKYIVIMTDHIKELRAFSNTTI